MTVYTVIGGWNYEGCDDTSLRVFISYESAMSYRKELEAMYDFAELRKVVVTP